MESLSAFAQVSKQGKAKRTNKIKYRPTLQVECITCTSQCSIWVQPEFMLLVLQAFHALKSHTDQKGFFEVCHHQPINAHEYSCSDGKAKTKHFSQLNTSTFFHHTNLIFRQLFSSFERFCNSHPTYCITGVTEVTLNCLSQVTNPLGFSEGGSTQILPTLTARRHSPADWSEVFSA